MAIMADNIPFILNKKKEGEGNPPDFLLLLHFQLELFSPNLLYVW